MEVNQGGGVEMWRSEGVKQRGRPSFRIPKTRIILVTEKRANVWTPSEALRKATEA